MPKLSIVIPVYNTLDGDLIKCLDTIRAQTYGDYEVLIIDDGSADPTKELCDKYASTDEKFKVFHRENGGVASARNQGIELSKGEWITFVDSDDWLDEYYLEGLVATLADNPDATVVVATKVRVNDDSDLYFKGINLDALEQGSTAETVIKNMPHSMWSYMFKRECLENVRVDTSLHFYEDLDFILQVYKTNRPTALCNVGGYHYRQGSVTHRKLTKRTLTAFDMVDKNRKNGMDEKLVGYLERKMILAVAFVGALDPVYDKELNEALKKRAKNYCEKYNPKLTRAGAYIRLLSLSPKLFYAFQRIKGKIKR